MGEDDKTRSHIDDLITYNDEPEEPSKPAPEEEYTQNDDDADALADDYGSDAENGGYAYDEAYDDDEREAADERIVSDTPEISDETDTVKSDVDIVKLSRKDRLHDGNGSRKAKRKKGGHGCLITVIVIAAIAALAAVIAVTDTGIIGAYKHNFVNNFSLLFGDLIPEHRPVAREDKSGGRAAAQSYRNNVGDSRVISFESAAGAKIVPYSGGVVCASANYLSYLDGSGNIVWEIQTAVVDPLLSAEGDYILIAEKGGRKLCLYNDKKLVYDVDDPDNIMAVKVTGRGDAVAVTDKSSYRGGISVYNKTGGHIYSWASGRDTVICAEMSASSRKIAVSLLNTDNTAKTVIQFFDINEKQSYAQSEINDTVVYDMEFTGGTLSAFGDSHLAVLTDNGRLLADIYMDNIQITHSAIDGDGNKLLAADDGNIPKLVMYGKSGGRKAEASIGGVTDCIGLMGKTVIYNIGRDIYFGGIDARKITKYTATMDIKKLIMTSRKSFVIVYSNSLEFVSTK